MVSFFGDYDTTETVVIPFNTFTSDDPSASATITNLAAGDVEIHKDGSTTQRASDNGVTVTIDFDSVTGNHIVSIDLSDNSDAGFYAAGSRYQVRIEGTTVDGATINAWIGAFSIGCTLRPATAGRTVVVDADGLVDANTVKIGPTGSGTAQTANDVGGDVNDILTDTGTTLPATLTTIEGKVDTVDGVADAVLVDTGTTLPATLTTIEGKIDTVDGVADSILTDTGTTLPATLSTMDGKLDTIDNFLDTEIASILEDTGTTLPAAISGLNNISVADIIGTTLAQATYAPQEAPPVNATVGEILAYGYKQWRNKSTADADSIDLYADDGTTVDQTRTLSYADSTLTKGEVGSGA